MSFSPSPSTHRGFLRWDVKRDHWEERIASDIISILVCVVVRKPRHENSRLENESKPRCVSNYDSKENRNLRLRDFLPVVHIHLVLLAPVVTGTLRLWLLGYCPDRTLEMFDLWISDDFCVVRFTSLTSFLLLQLRYGVTSECCVVVFREETQDHSGAFWTCRRQDWHHLDRVLPHTTTAETEMVIVASVFFICSYNSVIDASGLCFSGLYHHI